MLVDRVASSAVTLIEFDLADHDFCGVLMKVADARSFGRSDDPTTTAEDCDDSVDLVGDLVANILKNADF